MNDVVLLPGPVQHRVEQLEGDRHFLLREHLRRPDQLQERLAVGPAQWPDVLTMVNIGQTANRVRRGGRYHDGQSTSSA